MSTTARSRQANTRREDRSARARQTGPEAAEETRRTQARLIVESPIGALVLAGDDAFLTHVSLPGQDTAGVVPAPGRAPLPLQQAAAQLAEYFAGSRQHFDLPLAPRGTPFQVIVWQALADIPYGQTITYGELASRVGRPGAFRAVGQANGKNPLPIVYPCHRVVAARGRIGGYGGGLDMKRQLLALEGSPLAAAV